MDDIKKKIFDYLGQHEFHLFSDGCLSYTLVVVLGWAKQWTVHHMAMAGFCYGFRI